jgi:hypothetical protein
MIRYLRHDEIDTEKWNNCIALAEAGNCYADAAYLNAMATHWEALVMDDYQAVMPLTWRKKYGIRYLYQPSFCQQLGVFNAQGRDDLSGDFLLHVPEVFRYWDIQLNYSNKPAEFPFKERKNYLLSLNDTYQNLNNSYSRNANRNISAALKAGITVKENLDPSVLIGLHRKRFRTTGVRNSEFAAMEGLLRVWSAKGRAFIAGAVTPDGKVVASSAYLMYKDRITFIMNGNAVESLTNGATHLLKDHVIRKFCGRDLSIDFEGSDNPRFARFYEQFGAKTIEHYPRIINNNLPWPLKLFK